MHLKVRDVQTQVKHKILEKYLGAWGGIILNGLSRRARQVSFTLEHHFVYVDCFAYTGKYAGDQEKLWLQESSGPVEGSALIGIRALDAMHHLKRHPQVKIQTNAILIEEDPATFSCLWDNLHKAGFGDRTRETTDFSRLKPGEIAMVNADATALRDELISYTSAQYTKAFYLLDPFGAKGIPYEFVEAIVSQAGHDVMINFIYLDLERKAKIAVTGDERYRKHVLHWTAAFGSDQWIAIKQDIEEKRASRDLMIAALGITQKEAQFDPLFEKSGLKFTDAELTALTERRLVDLYQRTLQSMDSALVVKSIKLKFSDRERSMFYLFLATHNESGALELNRVLSEAKLWQYELRYIRNNAKRQLPPQHQPLLFRPETPQVPQSEDYQRPSISECARIMVDRFAPGNYFRRQIYKGMADEEYTQGEIEKAITQLSKRGKITVSGRRNYDARIIFL